MFTFSFGSPNGFIELKFDDKQCKGKGWTVQPLVVPCRVSIYYTVLLVYFCKFCVFQNSVSPFPRGAVCKLFVKIYPAKFYKCRIYFTAKIHQYMVTILFIITSYIKMSLTKLLILFLHLVLYPFIHHLMLFLHCITQYHWKVWLNLLHYLFVENFSKKVNGRSHYLHIYVYIFRTYCQYSSNAEIT